MKSLFALNRYIWTYKKQVLWGVVFVVLSNFFAIYPAQIVRIAINMVGDVVRFTRLFQDFSVVSELQSLLNYGLGLFGILVISTAIIRGIFLFLTRQTLIVMSRLVEYDLRNDIYSHLQDLSLSFYRRNRTGDLMARMTEDVSRVRMYLGPGIMYTINTFTLFIIVVTTMLTINPTLTFYALLPLPFLSYLIYYVESIIQQRSEKIQQQLSRLTTFTQEIYSGIRLVKAYVIEKPSNDKFSDECENYKEKSMHLAKIDALFFPIVVFLVGLSIVLTVWRGGTQVINNTLTVGNIAEFIIYINLLTWPIISVGWVTTLIQRAAASQKRLNELLAERSEISFSTSEQAQKTLVDSASISFRNISFKYPDTGIEALKEVSFDLAPGQKLGIMGPTGSGKSTLCALIPRLLDADKGQIFIDDKPIQLFTKDNLRNAIGYAPQDVFLFSDTIANNVSFGKMDASRKEIESATKKASVYHNIVDFPKGFDTLVGERGVTLSGGQKQRTSVARAWIREPKILIFDDVLSAVDTQTEEVILGNLRSYQDEHPRSSIVMVAHRISCIQDADLILVIENGKITQAGTHKVLLEEEEGYYARIYEKQLTEDQKIINS